MRRFRFLSVLPLLIGLLLSVPAAAQMPHYDYNCTSTGKATSQKTGMSLFFMPYSYMGNNCNGGIQDSIGVMGDTGSIVLNCSGPITLNVHWNPDGTTNPPPPAMVIQQICTASFSLTNQPGDTISGSCSDGLGDTSPAGVNSFTVSSSKYTVGYGATFSDSSCNPGSQIAGSNTGNAHPVPIFSGSVNVGYTAWVNPITIDLTGCNPANQALAGQQITATLNGLPTGWVKSYSWSFTGATAPNPIRNWDYTAPNSTSSTQIVPLASTDLTGTDTTGNGIAINPVSFYDQAADGSVIVNCQISLKFPDGTTATVNAKSAPVAFLKPTLDWTASQGGFVNDTANQQIEANEAWLPINITVPSSFSGGTGCLAQLITPNRSVTRHALNGKPSIYYYKIPHTNSDGSISWILPTQGLDTAFPYPTGFVLVNGVLTPVTPKGGYTWAANDTGMSGDTISQFYTTSDLDGGGNNWYMCSASDSLTTWVMYKPSAFTTQQGVTMGTVWIPLQKLSWKWGGTAAKDGNNNWIATAGPTSTDTSGTSVNDPPQWAVVLHASDQFHP